MALVGCTSGVSSTNPPSTAITSVGTPVHVDGGSYTDVTPWELASLLSEKSFPLIDVHIPYDGEIAQTDAFGPFNEVPHRRGYTASRRLTS